MKNIIIFDDSKMAKRMMQIKTDACIGARGTDSTTTTRRTGIVSASSTTISDISVCRL